MIYEKEGISKKNIIDFAFIFISIILMLGFANAVITSVMDYAGNDPAAVGSVNYTRFSGLIPTEDKGHIYNITINQTANAAVGAHNVTNVTIYFWGNFVLNSPFYASTTKNAANNMTGNLTGTADGAQGPYPYFSNVSTGGGWIQWNATNVSGWLYAANDSTATNTSWFHFNATAATPGKYNITVKIGYNWSGLYNSTNITILVNDTTKPSQVNITATSSLLTNVTHSNISGTITLNISAIDNGNLTAGAREDDVSGINITFWNSSGDTNWSYIARNLTGHFWNVSIDTTNIADGFYNVTISVNDTRRNINITNVSDVRVDNTKPTGTMVCNPDDAYLGGTGITCTCTGADGTSGVKTTSYTASPVVTTAGTSTQTCTITDYSGNSGTASDTVNVWGTTSSGGGSSGGSSTTVTKTTFSEITPTTPATMSGFASDSGVKEIKVEVSQTTSNVKLTVEKFATTPGAISTPVNEAYKYLKVDTQNLANKLNKATMTIQVEKTWVSNKGLTKNDISLFKYDETAKKWDELTTTFNKEDTTYYYYTVEVKSFSYFAIAPKESAISEPETPETPTGMSAKVWIVIVIIILIIAIGSGVAIMKKKKRR